MKLVLDWDGTVTERDTVELLIGRVERYLAERGIPYDPFDDPRDVLDGLSSKAVVR